MARERLGQIYHYLCKVAGQELASGLTDAQLVERFVSQRDEAAFEVLLWRHGTMVLNVCRRVLRQEQDVEDAFQATFLTFVRKARAISRRAAVAGWLYKVALRVALAARARSGKAQAREVAGIDDVADPTSEPSWNDLGPVLDEEMNRLPKRYRLPVVLCYLEGKTNEEAARELGCPAGTIFSRLARGREMLRTRLTRRGLALSTGLFTSLLVANAASATVSTPLVQATTKTAMLFVTGQAVAGVSAKVIALAEGVLKTMFLTKVKTTVAVLMAFGLLIAGAGALGYLDLNAAQPQDPPRQALPEPPPPVAKQPPVPKPKKEDIPLVKVVKPRPGGLERITNQQASVEPFEQVEIYAQVAGILKNQQLDIGDRVKKGQLLAEIDAPILVTEQDDAASNLESARDQIEISKALVVAAEAELRASKLRVNQQHAEVDSAESFLKFRKAKLQRFKELANAKAIDTKLVDEESDQTDAAQRRADASKAAVQAAEADIQVKAALVQKARADLSSRSSAVRAAEAKLEKARIMVSFTRSTAPFDGVITKRNFNNGEFIRAAEQGSPRALLTLTRIDRLRVVVHIYEDDVPYADPGDPVDLIISALPDRKFTGLKIARMASAVLGGTMRVEIDVPNKDNLLRPGMSGRATLHLEPAPKDRLTLAGSCLAGGLNGTDGRVYVIHGGKAHLTNVKIGYCHSDQMEIVSGLKANDIVVDSPFSGLLRGQEVPVRVRKDSNEKATQEEP